MTFTFYLFSLLTFFPSDIMDTGMHMTYHSRTDSLRNYKRHYEDTKPNFRSSKRHSLMNFSIFLLYFSKFARRKHFSRVNYLITHLIHFKKKYISSDCFFFSFLTTNFEIMGSVKNETTLL